MTILGLHHAQITIPRGAEAQGRQFYCDVLGLPEIEKPASLQGRGGFWLQVGLHQVHIGVEDGVERSATKAHLAYQVDDIEIMQKWLQESGIEIGDAIPFAGFQRFEIRDPFGNRVEFIQAL
ncbi:MAG: VOC family protein [Ktedonobacteraceae bacterium]